MKLIIGLGNPGRKYGETRHNIGFKVARALADKYRIRLSSRAFDSFVGKGRIFSEEVAIALPQTYMNKSGAAVKGIFLRKKAGIKDILVICDDVNLELGVIRIRPSGSSGGHRGLESIIEYLDTCDFARLRIGIGKDTQSPDLSGYVLSPFKKSEAKIVDGVIETAVECCEEWIKEGAERAANRFNLKNRKD